jgi:hypothetical protein
MVVMVVIGIIVGCGLWWSEEWLVIISVGQISGFLGVGVVVIKVVIMS